MATSSSSPVPFVGRGSSPSSSWPKMGLPPEQLVQQEPEKWVYGSMNYVTPSTELIYTRRDLAGSDGKLEGAEFVPTTVKVHNGRRLNKNLHQNGFQLFPNTLSNLDIDFYNQQEVVDKYYPHCEELLKSFLEQSSPNGEQVTVTAFDHNVRSNQGAGKTKLKDGGGATVQSPAGLVHADYTKVSAPRRLEQLGQASKKANDVRTFNDAKSVLDPNVVQEALDGKRRFAFINIWRNIDKDEPVQQFPLACIDATTVHTSDLRTFQIHYTDRVGENYFCCPCTRHEWCYFPQMKYNEVLLLKQWDSLGNVANGKDVDDELSTMTIHSAFMDPTIGENVPPRRSIEVRCVVIWDKDE